MIYDVYKFNKLRNKFELDEKLEVAMLVEEAQEFFTAVSVAERIDAYVDFEFVWHGTRIKNAYNVGIVRDEIKQWFHETHDLMHEILEDELYGLDVDSMIQHARNIVASINAMKAQELDINGKVMKQKDLPNATEEIAKMLAEYGVE